ncbi:alpha/beta fold hydrolase [Legionella jordanis]|uniref:Pimeloyl-[acyl-carrier protein] methyl ester esterase n=1 Tax=Legionella jordanis TaxID=456 RepID=A0A0W0VAZ1_9GAMM|nr:alpha/beta fold hydrolase [Legionella jordanis]KTD17247.1 biotin biosynthesis protein BioH [Legionella jordanis]RMX03361.1 alpha/beta fold hydrolase [Legionella jordanis]RMX15839.1 alpha/beta fold hydrolase [Legionella jordanis]VEH12555.1 biotin operon repressor and biotin [Legionella jordanis]HAT8713370.1 alpha/beta fold hydrolase [Legionella jordanis]
MQLNIKIIGSGPALVFFHGWGFDHKVWLPLANTLATKYQLYLVDLPGFGLSPLMGWDQFKEELLNRLPERFVLVGWSMGGLFASKLALEAQEKILHLVNIASSPRFIKEGDWPGVEKIVFQNFFKNLAIDPHKTINDFISLQFRNLNHSPALDFHPTIAPLKKGLEILEQWDLREQLLNFKKPASYWFGRLDAITPIETMKAMQNHYPQFNYVLFPRAAHMPFLSHQFEFLEHLEYVLNETFFYNRH